MSTINLGRGNMMSCEDYYDYLLNKTGNIYKLSEDVLACIDVKKLKKIHRRVDWINFSLRFNNNYPEKLNIIRPYLKWFNISVRYDLTENFIFEFKKDLHLKELNRKVLTNKIIEKLNDNLKWETVSFYKEISEELIDKYKDKLDWNILRSNRKFTKEEVKKYKDYLGNIKITDFKTIDEEILREYESEFNWKNVVLYYRDISCDLIDKHIEEIGTDEVLWSRIRKQNNLQEWFIMKYYNLLAYYSKEKSENLTLYSVLKNNNLSKKTDRSIELNDFLLKK